METRAGSRPARLLLALCCLCSAAGADAESLALQAGASTISITFIQMKVPLKAGFRNFSGRIGYDPAAPAGANAEVKIDVASIDLGDPEYNQEVLKPDWLDAARFPDARFISTGAAGSGAGLEISGLLTIKGQTRPVRFPVSLRSEGGRRIFDGRLPISRLAFRLGEGEWKDTSVVEDQVLIQFHLVGQP